MKAYFRFNEKLSGIEIEFDQKVSGDLNKELLDNGFKFSSRKGYYWAKQNKQTLDFSKSLAEKFGETFSTKVNATTKKSNIDLFELTRKNNLKQQDSGAMAVSDISAEIRKHIKKRFTMCKFSVTTKRSSIRIELLQSPWERDSEEVKAIVDYVEKYAESFNYCTHYDPYGDYGSSYKFYSSVYVPSYEYEVTENEFAEKISREFADKKAKFEEEERIREEIEFQKRLKEEEARRIEYERISAEREKKRQSIESKVAIEDGRYFVLNAFDTGRSKCDSIDEYFKSEEDYEPKHYLTNIRVDRDVHMDKESFDNFSKMLLDDWSFLSGMGGTASDDNLITSMTDYAMLSKEERENVETIVVNAVAIYCGNELKYIINPEGYDYARYVLFIDDDSKIVDEYTTRKSLSDEEYDENCRAAESITDLSSDVICKNDLQHTWRNEELDKYLDLMLEALKDSNSRFDISVVRAIKIEELKTPMYYLLDRVQSLSYQFDNAGFYEGQPITIVRFNGLLGQVSGLHGVYCSHKAVSGGISVDLKVIREHMGRNPIANDLRISMLDNEKYLIYNDHHKIPDKLFWETIVDKYGNVVRKTKLGCFDEKGFDMVLDYFESQGIKPLVNNCSKIFKEV